MLELRGHRLSSEQKFAAYTLYGSANFGSVCQLEANAVSSCVAALRASAPSTATQPNGADRLQMCTNLADRWSDYGTLSETDKAEQRLSAQALYTDCLGMFEDFSKVQDPTCREQLRDYGAGQMEKNFGAKLEQVAFDGSAYRGLDTLLVALDAWYDAASKVAPTDGSVSEPQRSRNRE